MDDINSVPVTYKVVFDFANNPTGASSIASILGPIFLGIFCLALTAAMSAIYLKCFPKWARNHIFLSGVFFLLFFSISCLAVNQLGQMSSLLASEIHQHPENIRTVEGVVTDVSEGLKWEKFCVQKACFRYDDMLITDGFNHSRKWGGPIRNGLHVRIKYIEPGNHILRLEIATP